MGTSAGQRQRVPPPSAVDCCCGVLSHNSTPNSSTSIMSTQIQELIAAETKASSIVAEARASRSKRMKEAKKEAEALCNAFRAEKEAAYQASMQKSMGSTGKEGDTLGAQTDAAIQSMTDDYSKNKEVVGDLLVHEVCHIVYSVPEGLKSREMQQA
ncbi:conserved unknown protein [Ectocarpus siliculosus]|uniref:V-type proton ATPase subunit G n=1 Tax=Ectocarpus siliculosus TaxID=2880 RepID=D7FJS2_ECTSI|nr:conserved unknown protein [Ectocarpus siliculosus]|eukprot:CBJ29174.1 conserved unknown protein [Ectocarpus siliculosus]